MNKDHVLFHLREAQEELESMILELNTEPEYGFGEYVIGMSHLYHHLNSAWNGRDASVQEVEECSQSNFETWRQMPTSEELLLATDNAT